MNRTWIALAVLVFLAGSSGSAQEKSVRPGINKNFQSGDPSQWVERWEREGREVYDKRAKIVELSGIKTNDVVADIGAGSGLFSKVFSGLVGDQGRVFSVDITSEFVYRLVTEARAKGVQNIVGVICSNDSCDLPENSIDVAYICATYHHFEFPLKTMASVHRALKKNGRVVLVDFERIPGKSSEFILGHVRAGKKVVIGEIESCDFELVEEKTGFLSENYLLIFKKKSPANSSRK